MRHECAVFASGLLPSDHRGLFPSLTMRSATHRRPLPYNVETVGAPSVRTVAAWQRTDSSHIALGLLCRARIDCAAMGVASRPTPAVSTVKQQPKEAHSRFQWPEVTHAHVATRHSSEVGLCCACDGSIRRSPHKRWSRAADMCSCNGFWKMVY